MNNTIPLLSHALTARQLSDLELLLVGGFKPLASFMTQDDYDSCVNEMQLGNGTIWPVPITLDVPDALVHNLKDNDKITLRDREGLAIAVMHVKEIWQPDKLHEARQVYGTDSTAHPGVNYLLQKTHPNYVSGSLEVIQLPKHHDFMPLRSTPDKLKESFKLRGIKKVVGFQTRNPMHRAHHFVAEHAQLMTGAHLLVQPAVGHTPVPEDVDIFMRIRCYEKVMPYFSHSDAQLHLLSLGMRMAGPKEALWHGIIRKNYGCTHFAIGRDHAGPNVNGQSFYAGDAAQKLFLKHQDQLGIEGVIVPEVAYCKSKQTYLLRKDLQSADDVGKLSGTEFKRRLRSGEEMPSWYTFPEVLSELKAYYVPRAKQGFTVLFTGLPQAGKSTLAHALRTKLYELTNRKVTLLDGDKIRHLLSSELGFTEKDRKLNIARVAFVAKEITKHGGICIVSMIAPYQVDRRYFREQVLRYGGFVEAYVSTPVETCEKRDTKGHYKMAREKKLKNYTGVSSPYEIPEKADICIDTSKLSVDDGVSHLIDGLSKEGYVCEPVLETY